MDLQRLKLLAASSSTTLPHLMDISNPPAPSQQPAKHVPLHGTSTSTGTGSDGGLGSYFSQLTGNPFFTAVRCSCP